MTISLRIVVRNYPSDIHAYERGHVHYGIDTIIKLTVEVQTVGHNSKYIDSIGCYVEHAEQ